MPELPEVETTRLGLLPHLLKRRITGVAVRDARLRWPVPADLAKNLTGQRIDDITRRGKYLLFDCGSGFLLAHLGMSGSLRYFDALPAPQKHDHVDIVLEKKGGMRFTDPRRFGTLLWIDGRQQCHPLLDGLGIEPLSADFNGAYLFAQSRNKRVNIKPFLMDAHVVVGVGNIYASESLFRAGIHPARMAGRISAARYDKLAAAVKETLQRALKAGGSSLRDYVRVNGDPGYFQFDAFVYERVGLPCRICGTPIKTVRQSQRTTFYCPSCQK